jgi:hypothetical protein
VELGEAGEGTVVCLLHLGREDAGGKLVVLEVVGDAFAAFALAGAGFVGAGALGFVDLNLAFHRADSIQVLIYLSPLVPLSLRGVKGEGERIF